MPESRWLSVSKEYAVKHRAWLEISARKDDAAKQNNKIVANSYVAGLDVLEQQLRDLKQRLSILQPQDRDTIKLADYKESGEFYKEYDRIVDGIERTAQGAQDIAWRKMQDAKLQPDPTDVRGRRFEEEQRRLAQQRREEEEAQKLREQRNSQRINTPRRGALSARTEISEERFAYVDVPVDATETLRGQASLPHNLQSAIFERA